MADKSYKILAIGNSFSQDATRYLYQVARSQGVDFKVVNLYIGGCPLSYHYRNTLTGEKKYLVLVNGYHTGFYTSIEEALMTEAVSGWDVVTMQQASRGSINYDTYQPYLNELSAFVKKFMPHTKQYIHETWSYKEGSNRLIELGYEKEKDMYNDLKKAYKKAFKEIKADGLIPSGKALQNLIANGIENTHRDDIHLSLGIGRLTAALVWYSFITGNKVESLNGFNDFDEPISEEEIKIAIKSAMDAVEDVKKF